MARRSRTAKVPALPGDLRAQLKRALAEDRVFLDRTSRAILPARRRARARIVAEAPGTLSGVEVAIRLAREAGLAARARRADGEPVRRGEVVLELEGNARRLLGVERTLLNYLMHLSGVATATRTAVRAARGRVEILATRKTLPGLRDLEKAAVLHGGGGPHRRDLSEAFLVKTTHTRLAGLEPAVRAALRAARGRYPVEVEVRTLGEAVRAVRAGARRLLIDNAGPSSARRIVRGLVARSLRRGVHLELSGGISPRNVARYRATGADALSLGSLTHSAPALPFHLVLERPDGRRAPAR